MDQIKVHLERVCERSIRGFQEQRDRHPGGPWRQEAVADFLCGLYLYGCYEALYIHAEILAAENTVLRQKVCAVQNGCLSNNTIAVTIEDLDDACVKRLQEERANHQGGPWRKDPVTDFIVRLWVSRSHGAVYKHAEILAAENAALRRQLFGTQE